MQPDWVTQAAARLAAASPALGILPADSTPQGTCLHLPVGDSGWQVICPAEEPGAAALLQLAADLAGALWHQDQGMDEGALWRAFLLGEGSAETLADLPSWDAAAGEGHRVLALQLPQAADAAGLLADVTPLQPGELLVPMAPDTVALLKSLTDGKTLDEAEQYALALQETVLTETGQILRAAISPGCTHRDQLPQAWAQAAEALRIGARYHPGESLYSHERLIVERLVEELTPEKRGMYHQLLLKKKGSRLDAETRRTLDAFFQADLSLSNAARQLYIHRNTLNYRLDKLQRQTGLDVRHFHDAMTLRLLMMLGEPVPAGEPTPPQE